MDSPTSSNGNKSNKDSNNKSGGEEYGGEKTLIDGGTWVSMFGAFSSEPEIEKSVALFPGDEPEKRYHRAKLLVKSRRSERVRSALSILVDLLKERHPIYEKECLYYTAAGHYMLGNAMECKLWISRLLRFDPQHSQGLALRKTVEAAIREERARRIKQIKQKEGKLRKRPGLLRVFNTQSSGQLKTNDIIDSLNKRVKERRKSTVLLSQEHREEGDDGNTSATSLFPPPPCSSSPSSSHSHPPTLREPDNAVSEDADSKAVTLDTPVDHSWQGQVITTTFLSRFTNEELQSLIKSFQSIDKIHATAFDKAQFAQATGPLGFNDNDFVFRYLFSAFEIMQSRIQAHNDPREHGEHQDTDETLKKLNSISLIEIESYLCVMAILLKGSPDERLNLAFDMMTYGSKDEHITEDKLANILKSIFDLLARLGVIVPPHQHHAASEIFALLDTKRQRQLSRSEFVQMALKNYGIFAGLGLFEIDGNDAKGIPENRARGSRIYFGSNAWNQTMRIVIGMRITQSMLQPLPYDIRPEDFYTELKIRLPTRSSIERVTDNTINGSANGVHHPGVLGSFIEFAPHVFQRLRQLFGISEQDFAKSIGLEHFCGNLMLGNLTSQAMQESDGRSGSYFFYSHDGKFLIKYIPEKEMQAFKRLLPHYYAYVLTHPQSLITEFVSCFRQDGNDFIVMNNVFSTTRTVHEIYDLKGSRIARSNPEGPVYKDNDLTRDIDIGAHKKQLLLEVIHEDIKILHNLKFTDYSILLGVHYLDMTAFNESQNEKQQMTVRKRRRKSEKKEKKEMRRKEKKEKKKKKKKKNVATENVSCDNSGLVSDEESLASNSNDRVVHNQGSDVSALSGNEEGSVVDECNRQDDVSSTHSGEDKSHDGHVIIHNRNQRAISQTTDSSDIRSEDAMSKTFSSSAFHSIEDTLFEKDGGVLSRDGRCIYYFGIIDTLTEFSMKKAAERNLKTLKYPTRRSEISSQPPDEYAQRMKEFMNNKIC